MQRSVLNNKQRFFWYCIGVICLFEMIHIPGFVIFSDPSTTAHPTEQINEAVEKPEQQQLFVAVQDDDLLFGKSCLRSKNSITMQWDCRDCGLKGLYNARTDCPPMEANGVCHPIRNSTWDDPPRQASTFSATSSTTSHHHLITHYGMREEFQQIQCDSLHDCFNVTKCKPTSTTKTSMKLFAHGDNTSLANELVTLAVQNYPTMWERTLDASEACLLVVTCDSYSNVSQFLDHFYHDGKNHFIWDSPECFGSHGDRPFNTAVDFKYAALSTSTLTDANIRRGYDIPVTRVRGFTIGEFCTSVLPQTFNEDNSNYEPRKYLLSFKGNIFNWEQVWWQHRWLAAEYWNSTNDDESDVIVDVKCGGLEDYRLPHSSFNQLLLQSTFGFSPGGGSVGSYRFAEILGLGGIPVVVSDFIPPMWPELDWSGCLVRVSETRIVDLPDRLRNMTKKEISDRQQRCKILFQLTIGWKQVNTSWWEIDSGEQAFLTSMRIWYVRMQEYFLKQQQQFAFENELIAEFIRFKKE